MKALQNKPKPLVRQITQSLLIGCGCLLVGAGIAFSTKDMVTLWISIAVLVGSLYKAYDIYSLVSKNKYVIVVGICQNAAYRFLQKTNRVTVADELGDVLTLDVPRSCRLRVGLQYRFYFRRAPTRSEATIDFIKIAMTSEAFLAVEEDLVETQSNTPTE